MKYWIWNILISISGILGIMSSLEYDGTILMGISCFLLFNTIFMSFVLYKIENNTLSPKSVGGKDVKI